MSYCEILKLICLEGQNEKEWLTLRGAGVRRGEEGGREEYRKREMDFCHQ